MSSRPSDRLSRLVLAIVAAAVAGKILLGALDYGFLSGDDLEVVEGAAKYVLGLEYQPWSLRCLFHPVVLVAPILEVGLFLGVPSDPLTVAWMAALPTIIASTVTVWLTFRLASLLGLPRSIGALSAFFYATHWLPLGYGSLPYPRPISTMFFVLALLLVLERGEPGGFVGGLLVSAAFAVRFSEGVLVVPFLLVVWLRHRRATAIGLAAAGVLLGALLFAGLTDLATWGRPFASLAEFVRIMHVDRPPSFPHYDRPWFRYSLSVLRWAGPVAVILVVTAARQAGSKLPLTVLGLTVVGYSFSSYKAFRYLQSAIPLLAILMGIGCAQLLGASQKWRRAAGWLALLLAPLWGAERTVSLLADRSRSAVDAALFIKTLNPRLVLLEQGWAYGDRLVLGNDIPIRDLEPRTPIGLGSSASLDGVDVAAFYERDLAASDRELLERAGFRSVRRFPAQVKTVVVFRRMAGFVRSPVSDEGA
jgi:Alg9-like mannosyltransferase family